MGFVLTLSPERIILGGSVMQQQLFPLIHAVVRSRLNGYIRRQDITQGIARYIVPPGLGDLAGVLGSMALAANQQLT